MNAETVRLGDVATFLRGITFKPVDILDEVTPDAIGCMRTKNVQTQLDETDVWFLPKKFLAAKNQLLQEGDLLVSTANSWNLVGKACWVPKLDYDCTFGGFISALRATDTLVDRRYLYYWFTSTKIQSLLRSFGNKTTNISNLSIKRANDLVIPLPTLEKQKHIAAILDKVTELKDKREQVLENLKNLKVSLYVESVASSGPNIINFKVGDVIEQVRGVTYSSGDSTDEYKDGYVELLRANNICDGDLDFENLVFVPKNKVTDKQYLKENDIVIAASSGSLSVVGKAAPFHGSRLTSFGAFCKVLRPKSNVDARYIANYFQTKEYRHKVSSLAEGANINNLRNEHIDNLSIRLPELHEQKRIADIIAYIDLQIDLTRTAMRSNADMIASLQHQAFTTGFNA